MGKYILIRNENRKIKKSVNKWIFNYRLKPEIKGENFKIAIKLLILKILKNLNEKESIKMRVNFKNSQ